MRRLVVKVQIPLACTGEPAALVYNRDRSIEFECPITEGIRDWMDGRAKMFFWADVDEDTQEFQIQAEAPREEW